LQGGNLFRTPGVRKPGKSRKNTPFSEASQKNFETLTITSNYQPNKSRNHPITKRRTLLRENLNGPAQSTPADVSGKSEYELPTKRFTSPRGEKTPAEFSEHGTFTSPRKKKDDVVERRRNRRKKSQREHPMGRPHPRRCRINMDQKKVEGPLPLSLKAC